MKKKIGIDLLCVVVIGLFVACSPEGPELNDNVDVVSSGASVWIDTPLDQSTIPPTQTAVVAHANVPTGISAFQFWVDGNMLASYPLTSNDYGASFAMMTQAWLPSSDGWHILKVDALGMLGEVMASAEIDILVAFEEPDDVQQPPDVEQAIASPTPTQEPVQAYSRCDLFNPQETTLTLYDILPGSTGLNLHILLPGPVPGLEEPVEGDNDPWLYSAILGSTEAEACAYQGYTRRLYCSFILPESVLDTVQPLDVFVNLCGEPIFSHPRVSILAPLCQSDMNRTNCEATGGSYTCIRDICTCTCP